MLSVCYRQDLERAEFRTAGLVGGIAGVGIDHRHAAQAWRRARAEVPHVKVCVSGSSANPRSGSVPTVTWAGVAAQPCDVRLLQVMVLTIDTACLAVVA